MGGLEFLHSRKIIHRDIKPANILLQGETPRLADFGVSRIMKTTSVSVHLSGTPGYMAPESFDRKRTVQTDLWSVGVILYQMLKGILPFPYDNFTELLGAIVLKEPDPLPDSVPPVLRGIVFRALAKDPGERFQSAREMRAALADFLIGIAQSSLSQTVEMPLPVLSPTVEMPLPVLSPTVETTLPAEVETVVRSVAAPVAPTIESSAVGRAAEIEIPAPDEETDSPADDPKIPGYLKIAAILGLLAVVFGVVYLVGRDRIPAANTVATGAEGKDNAANATASKTVAANQNGVESSKQTEPATDQAGQNSAEFDSRMKAAQLYYEKGNYAKAIENLRAANRLNPDNYEVLVNLGNANFDAENYEEAAEWYMSALARKPDDTNVRTDLGLTYMMRRTPDYDRGIEELNKVLETNPDNPPALQNLTVAYTKKGDAARAGEMLARFEKVDPKNPAIPKLRAGIQKIAGK